MLDHVDKLTPAKGGKYICPVCDGNDLSISKTGAYKCWSNNCDTGKIRDAVAPWSKETEKEYKARKSAPKSKSSKDLDQDAFYAAVAIECKIDELVYKFDSGDEISASKELLDIELAAWCKAHGHNAFTAGKLFTKKLKDLAKARRANKAKERETNPEMTGTITIGYRDDDDDDEKSRMLREYDLIKKRFDNKFRWNELFKQVEFEGEKFSIGSAKSFFNIKQRMNLKSGRDDIADIVLMCAKDNSYNPITDYLDQCFLRHGSNTDILDGMAKRYLGVQEDIYQTLLIKWLTQAVARAYEPGCKADNALILQGPQGFLKSSFFEALAGRQWFDDTMGTASEKDERMKLHRTWIVEWAELETIFKKKDIAAVKSFMTTKTDILRPPYGRDFEELLRPSVFCGTTNPKEFLTDTTGNRRFWVIPITKRIDIPQLKKERDQIWGAIVTLYRNHRDGDKTWHLTEEEDKTLRETQAQFASTDTWDEEIADFLEGKDRVATWEILDELLKLPIALHDKKTQGRVRECLYKLNWTPNSKTVWHKGKASKVWAKVL